VEKRFFNVSEEASAKRPKGPQVVTKGELREGKPEDKGGRPPEFGVLRTSVRRPGNQVGNLKGVGKKGKGTKLKEKLKGPITKRRNEWKFLKGCRWN